MSLWLEPKVISCVGHIFNLFISCFPKSLLLFLLTAKCQLVNKEKQSRNLRKTTIAFVFLVGFNPAAAIMMHIM